ncbi:MAG: PspC domain-containing protein [Rhodococcus sp. (in: high G+C Gram-positive bacteria)]|uniref:PspC domain-containing protein n=1 Tax=Rhodococcus sp. TaxID=1831 RepID=UPI003BB02887
MNNGSFHEQMQDLWRTRPVRLPSRGHVAGVCAGIGHRYSVDPVLVRVAFVVSTIFGGAGVLLYLACWLALPKSGDPASPAESLIGRGYSSDSGTKTIVLLVAFAIAITTVGPFGVGLGGSGLISLALMLGGLWLLYQRQPVPPAPAAGPAVPGASTGYPGTTFSPGQFGANQFGANPFGANPFGANPFGAGPYTGYSPYTRLPDSYTPSSPSPAEASSPAPQAAADPERQQVSFDKQASEEAEAGVPTATTPSDTFAPLEPRPPAWDPLGVAPFAWDLPEPAQKASVPTPMKRQHSRLTTTVLGLAVLSAAAATAVAVATGSDWLTPGRIGAIALAVIAVGLLVGSVLRKGYGLLVVTGPLAGFVVLASLVGPLELEGESFGEHTWKPLSAADLEPEYSGNFGTYVVDLRNVTLNKDETVTVDAKFGEMTVIVPQNMNVRNDCSVQFGEARCLPDGLDGGADGKDGPVLNLDVNAQFGEVEVRRG